MKVFKRGLFIILVDGNAEEFIPIESLYFRVSDDIVVFVNYDNANTYNSATSAIQNEAGAAVGNAAAVKTYLEGLTESVSGGSGTANSPSQQELTDPSSVTIAGWKKLDFACSGTIDVTIDGTTIAFPKVMGASTVLGASYNADTVTVNSVLFNGTGTVLITTQS